MKNKVGMTRESYVQFYQRTIFYRTKFSRIKYSRFSRFFFFSIAKICCRKTKRKWRSKSSKCEITLTLSNFRVIRCVVSFILSGKHPSQDTVNNNDGIAPCNNTKYFFLFYLCEDLTCVISNCRVVSGLNDAKPVYI